MKARIAIRITSGAAILSIAGLVAATPSSASPGLGSDAAVIPGDGLSQPSYTEEFAGGLVYAEFPEGVRVVAPLGSTIETGSVEQGNGSSGSDWLSITPPGDVEGAEYPDVIALAVKVGMFTDADASALQAAGGPGFAPNACADIDNSHGWMHGCYSREMGSSSNYWGTESVASFKSKGIYAITEGRTQHNYSSRTEVRTWRPLQTVNVGSCTTIDLSLSYRGIGLSTSADICPQKLEPDVAGGSKMHGVWKNWRSVWRSVRATEAIDAVWKPSGVGTGFGYRVSFNWRLA